MVSLDGYERGNRPRPPGRAPDDLIRPCRLAGQHGRAFQAEALPHLILDVTKIVDRALPVGCRITRPETEPVIGTYLVRLRERIDEEGPNSSVPAPPASSRKAGAP